MKVGRDHRARGVWQLEQPLDDRVKVGHERVVLDAFAEVDQGCGGVYVGWRWVVNEVR